MEQKLNERGDRRGMWRAERPTPAPRSHPWFKAKHGSAQFKTPEGFTPDKFTAAKPISEEEFFLVCPHGLCDGLGIVFDNESARECLCKVDRELDEIY